MPTLVERLASLCILDATDNEIRDDGLPMSLSRLPHLRAIGLKKNCLTTVPRMLGYVNSLQEIFLEENANLEVCLGQVYWKHQILSNILGSGGVHSEPPGQAQITQKKGGYASSTS